jgi:hypothetical protein
MPLLLKDSRTARVSKGSVARSTRPPVARARASFDNVGSRRGRRGRRAAGSAAGPTLQAAQRGEQRVLRVSQAEWFHCPVDGGAFTSSTAARRGSPVSGRVRLQSRGVLAPITIHGNSCYVQHIGDRANGGARRQTDECHSVG